MSRHAHRLRHLTAALKTTRVRTLALAAVVACLFCAAYLPQILRLPMVPGASSPFSSSAIFKPSSALGAKETGTAPAPPQRPDLSSERAREEGDITSRIADVPSLHSGVDTTPPGSNVGFCTEQYYLPPPFFVANEDRKGKLNEHAQVNENETHRESDQSSFPCPLRGVQYSHRTVQQVFGGSLDPRTAPTRPWCAVPVSAAPSFATNADGKTSHEKNKFGGRRPEEELATGRDTSLSTPYAGFLQKSEVFTGAKLQTVAVEHDMRRWLRQKAYPELFWNFFVANVSVQHPHQSSDNTHNENSHNRENENEQKSNDVGNTKENPPECGQVLSENPDLSYVTAASAAVEFSRHQTATAPAKPSSNRKTEMDARSPHHEEIPKAKGAVHGQAHRPHGQSKHAEQHHTTRSKRLELVPPVKTQSTPRAAKTGNQHGRKVLEHGAATPDVSSRKQMQCRGLVNPCSWSPRTPPSRPDRTTFDLRQLIDVADAADCAVPDTMPRRATVHHMMKMNAARSVSPMNENEKEISGLKKKESSDSKGKATASDRKPVSRSKPKRIDTWRQEDLSSKISPLFGHDAGSIPEVATVAAQANDEDRKNGDHTDMKQRREVHDNKEVHGGMSHHDHSHVAEQTEAAKVLFGSSGTQLKPTRVSREGSYLKIDNVCMRCERRQPNRKFLPAGRECGTTLYSIGAHSADLQFELLSPRSNNRHKLFVDREQAFQYGGVLYELSERKSTDTRPRKNTSSASPEKPENQEGEDQTRTKKEGKAEGQSLFDVRLIQNDPTASQPSRKMFSIGVRLPQINGETTATEATEEKRFAAEVKNRIDAESQGQSATMIHHVSGCTVYAAPFTVANVGHVLHDYVAGFATALHRCVFGFPSYLSSSTDGRTSNNANQDSRKKQSTLMNQPRSGVEAQGTSPVPPARVLMDYDFAKLTSPYAQLLTNITAHELLQLTQNHGGSSSGVTRQASLMVRTPQAQRVVHQQRSGDGSKHSKELQKGQHNGKERRSAGSHRGSTVFGFPSTVTAAERALFDDDEPFTCFESLLVPGMDRGLSRSLVEKKAVVRALRRAVHRLLPEVVPADLFSHDDQSSRKLKTSPSHDARGDKPKSDSAKVDDERIVGAPPAAAPPKAATETTSTKSKDGKVKAPKTPKPTPAPWVDDHMTGRLRDLFSMDPQRMIQQGGLGERGGHGHEGGGHAHHDDRSFATNTVKNIERVKPQIFVYGRNDVERRSIDNIGFLFTAVSAMARSYALPPPVIITTLEMPVSQQLRLFSSMDVLVSMQGAHLEQTVFMLAPDAIVIELVPCQGRKTSFIKAHGKLFEPHTHAQIELCRPALSLSELEVQPQNVTLCPHHAGVVARLLEPHLRLMLHGRGLL